MRKWSHITIKLTGGVTYRHTWNQPNLRIWPRCFSTEDSSHNGGDTSTKDNSSRSIRESILLTSLKYINQYGWSNECLAQATKDLGLPPLTHRVVRRGAPEIVQFIMDKKRVHVQSMISDFQANLSSHEDIDAGVHPDDFDEKLLKTAILGHLEYLQPYQNTWAEAIAISLHPNELPYSLPTVFTLVDDLCYFAEIKSSRIDWYTERALMMYLYGSTELYMLTDTSEEMKDTR